VLLRRDGKRLGSGRVTTGSGAGATGLVAEAYRGRDVSSPGDGERVLEGGRAEGGWSWASADESARGRGDRAADSARPDISPGESSEPGRAEPAISGEVSTDFGRVSGPPPVGRVSSASACDPFCEVTAEALS
jgi:hypothetical protein